jgi:hypothetical protein
MVRKMILKLHKFGKQLLTHRKGLLNFKHYIHAQPREIMGDTCFENYENKYHGFWKHFREINISNFMTKKSSSRKWWTLCKGYQVREEIISGTHYQPPKWVKCAWNNTFMHKPRAIPNSISNPSLWYFLLLTWVRTFKNGYL